MSKKVTDRVYKLRHNRNKVAQALGVPSWPRLGTMARDGKITVMHTPAGSQAKRLADLVREEFPGVALAVEQAAQRRGDA